MCVPTQGISAKSSWVCRWNLIVVVIVVTEGIVVVVTEEMKLNRRRSRRIVPYPTDLTIRTDGYSEHYRLCWRILIRPSWWWRYRSVGGEWFVKHQRFFSLSFLCGTPVLGRTARRSLGFSLGLSMLYGRSWLRHPIHFILMEDQVHIYVMHFSTSYWG